MAMSRPAKKQKVERRDWERADSALCCPSALVGTPVRVFWPDEGRYFQGKIVKFLEGSFQHKVYYDDGDEETLLLAIEKVQIPSECLRNMPTASPVHLAALACRLEELANELGAKAMQRTARGRAMLKEEDRQKFELLRRRAVEVRSVKEHREALLCVEKESHLEHHLGPVQAAACTPARVQLATAANEAAAAATCALGHNSATPGQQFSAPRPFPCDNRRQTSIEHRFAGLSSLEAEETQPGGRPPRQPPGRDCGVVPFRVCSPATTGKSQKVPRERRLQPEDGLDSRNRANSAAVPANCEARDSTSAHSLQPGLNHQPSGLLPGRRRAAGWGVVPGRSDGDFDVGKLYLPCPWPVLRATISAADELMEPDKVGQETALADKGDHCTRRREDAIAGELVALAASGPLTCVAGGDLRGGVAGAVDGSAHGKAGGACRGGIARARLSVQERLRASTAATELRDAYKHFRQQCSGFKQYHEIQVVLWLSPERLVGREIRVLWPDEAAWFCGRVTRYDPGSGMHTVEYDDGDVEHLHLAAEEVRLQVVTGEAEHDLAPRPPEELQRVAACMERNAVELRQRICAQGQGKAAQEPAAMQAKAGKDSAAHGVDAASNEDSNLEDLEAKADRWSSRAAQLRALATLMLRSAANSVRAGGTGQLPPNAAAQANDVAVTNEVPAQGCRRTAEDCLETGSRHVIEFAMAGHQAPIVQAIHSRSAPAAAMTVESAVVSAAAGAVTEIEINRSQEGHGPGPGCDHTAGVSDPGPEFFRRLPHDWAASQVLRPGEVVWAQVRRSTPWPAIIITREEATREGLNTQSRKNLAAANSAQIAYVRFFGDYTVLGLPVVEPGARIPDRGGVLPFLAGLELGWHARIGVTPSATAEDAIGRPSAEPGTGAYGQRFLRAMFELRTYMMEGELPRRMIPPNFDEDDDEDAEEELPQERHKGAAAGGLALNGTPSTGARRTAGRRDSQHIPMATDDDGHVTLPVSALPLVLGRKLRVLQLGKVVWLSRWFHDEKYIYPVGYTASRLMASGASGGREVQHLMEVVASEDGVRPLFRITPEGKAPVSADTATRAMRALFEDDDRVRGRAFAKTGADLFGLSHPRVASLLRSLPGAERCERFANWPDQDRPPLPPLTPWEELQRRAMYARSLRLPRGVEPVPQVKAGMAFECEVCGEDVESQGNLKLECDLCRCVVHSRCYGVKQPPHGSLWLCDVCQLHAAGLPQDQSPPCELCPVAGGPMKRTETGGYVHVLCAVWTPGVTFGDPECLEPVERVAKVVQNRASLRCSLCKQPHGACIQCAGGVRCYTAFHPMCAREGGLAMCELRLSVTGQFARRQHRGTAAAQWRRPPATSFSETTGAVAMAVAAAVTVTSSAVAEQEDCKENQPANANAAAAVATAVLHTNTEVPDGTKESRGVTLPVSVPDRKLSTGIPEFVYAASTDIQEAPDQLAPTKALDRGTAGSTSLEIAAMAGSGSLQRRGRGRSRNGARRTELAAAALDRSACLGGTSLGNGISLACFCQRHEDLVLHQAHVRCSYPGGRFANRRAELIREQLRARRQQLLEEHALNQPHLLPPLPQHHQNRLDGVEQALQGTTQSVTEPMTGRGISFANWRTRGHRAPEAVAIAREKRVFVRQLPYLVTGRLQQDASALQDLDVKCVRTSSACRGGNHGARATGADSSSGATSGRGQVDLTNDHIQDRGGKEQQESGSIPGPIAPAPEARVRSDLHHAQGPHGWFPTQLVEAAVAAGARPVAERYAAMRATVVQRLAAGKSAIHGWGAFAKVPHRRGDMLIEYVGELIRPSVSDVREKRVYDKLVGCGTYIFTLNEEQHIDATRAGNMAHLLNHSCNPNCFSRTITLSDPVTGATSDHVIITAKRDIEAWEELTYDYRFNSAVELPCNCGASTCRLLVNWPEPAEEEEDEEGWEEEGQEEGGYGDNGTREASGGKGEDELVRGGIKECGKGASPRGATSHGALMEA
ncbi:hypothetical protein VaNZ11_013821 [Volvox africanus]|uniref:Histone-lysine N-methyltransferase n=1 Tax=Volvox africanus TaxID=51714 RepID=A0ABQ5SI82_9CHLO|nr:hypothetical protein VaNZ11_013821 [Volvox africanus]